MIVDNQIIKLLVTNPTKILENPSLSNLDNQLDFRWSSLLQYLELGSLFSSFPTFDQNHPFFRACISTLCANEETEVLFHMYDRLFTEILNQIRNLPQINPTFLLQAIKKQRQKETYLEIESILSPILDEYETSLKQNTSDTMHDLILYLAWDRMCVYMARLFDYQSTDPKFTRGISILRECLIESYQHIVQQNRTTPGIYRMFESFLFYQMREENFKKLTDLEWSILSQSFQVLKPQDELVDFHYIDAVVPEKELNNEEESSEYYLTLDSPSRIKTRLSFARYMVNKLKVEVTNWGYALCPKKIVYLES